MKQSSKHRLGIPIVVALVFTVVVIALVVLVGVYVCKTESSTAAAGLDSADQTTTTDNLSGNLAAVLGKINNAAAGKPKQIAAPDDRRKQSHRQKQQL